MRHSRSKTGSLDRLSFFILFGLALTAAALQPATAQAQEAADDGVVVIEAEDYAFDAPDEIPSGWNTFRYENTGEEPHLLFIADMPENRGREDYELEIMRPFAEGVRLHREGELSYEEALEHIMTGVPQWFGEVVLSGGTGVIHEGDATEVTLHLDPGTYVLECYMKTEDGEMHHMEGMVRELTVTEEPSGVSPPEPDAEITLSNFEMDVEGDLEPGRQTVAVHAEEQGEGLALHNVHVAQDDEAEPDEVLRWLDFLEVDGMSPPAPYRFLGGLQILPEGETGYFTVDLEPGRHLFLSEYTGAEGVLQEVIVEP